MAVLFEQPVLPGKYKLQAKFNFDRAALNAIKSLQFEVVYPSRPFRQFQLWYTYVLVVFSVLLFIGYLCFMCSVKWRMWSYIQQWLLILCVALIFSNNPFFAFSMQSRIGWVITFLGIMFQLLFISLLMVFWLATLALQRYDEDEIGWHFMFLIPKFCCVMPFFLCSVVAFGWTSLANKVNPLNAESNDFASDSTYKTFHITVIISIVVYLLYLFFLFARSFAAMSHLSERQWGFFIISFPVLVFNLVSILAGSFYLHGDLYSYTDTGAYLSWFAVQNVYVGVLVYLYRPLTKEETQYSRTGTDDDVASQGTSV